MNRFKKFTSFFDRDKLNLYKRFLKKKDAATEATSEEIPLDSTKAKSGKTKEIKQEKKDEIPLEVPITSTSKPLKQKFFLKEGPHLYISKLLNAKGPMTAAEMWVAYQKDQEAVNMKVFQSKHFLAKKVVPLMIKQGKITKAGYSFTKGKHLGYSLIPEKAFKRTDPEVLVKIQPRPNIKRFERAEIIDLLKQMEMREKEAQGSG